MDGIGIRNIKKSFGELKWYEWLMCAVMVAIAARAMVISFTQGSSDGNPPWLTVINFISAVCGVLCIFFCAKASISNFVFATVNTRCTQYTWSTGISGALRLLRYSSTYP